MIILRQKTYAAIPGAPMIKAAQLKPVVKKAPGTLKSVGPVTTTNMPPITTKNPNTITPLGVSKEEFIKKLNAAPRTTVGIFS